MTTKMIPTSLYSTKNSFLKKNKINKKEKKWNHFNIVNWYASSAKNVWEELTKSQAIEKMVYMWLHMNKQLSIGCRPLLVSFMESQSIIFNLILSLLYVIYVLLPFSVVVTAARVWCWYVLLYGIHAHSDIPYLIVRGLWIPSCVVLMKHKISLTSSLT